MSQGAKTFLEQLKESFREHEDRMFEYHRKFFEDYNRLSLAIEGTRSAKSIINIKEGKEYNKEKFFTLQCVNSNSEECIIMTENGVATFPPNSFVKGATYPINLLLLKQSGGVQFIGYIS